MARKFLAYQDLLILDISNSLPVDLLEFFRYQVNKGGEISIGEGSLEQTHIDGLNLLNYRKNINCTISDVDATERIEYTLSRRSESIFTNTEVDSLAEVYSKLYPGIVINQVPMFHEQFHKLQVSLKRFSQLNLRVAIPQQSVLIGQTLVLLCQVRVNNSV